MEEKLSIRRLRSRRVTSRESVRRNENDYEKYVRERNVLIDFSFKQQADLDKWLITLSGGALGLSWTAVTWLMGEIGLAYVPLLVFGWSFLVASLVATVLSMRNSVDAYDEYRTALDESYSEYSGTNELWDRVSTAQAALPFNDRVERWNRVGLVGLVFGLIFVSLFVALNMPGGSAMEERQGEILNEGSKAPKTAASQPKSPSGPSETRGGKAPSSAKPPKQ